MSQTITISSEDILHQVNISCQLPSIIQSIVNRKIIAATAAKHGIEAKPEELQQAVDSIRILNQLRSAEDTWKWLRKHNLSLDDFEEIAYSSVISSKLANHLFADKIEPFFLEHQLDYTVAAIYEVILDDKDLALELFYALQEAEISFPEVARQYIQDTKLRHLGGYKGLLRHTDLKPDISAAVFTATPPQVLKPIMTSKGVHLILVEAIIQPQLDERLHTQILSDLFSSWLAQQIAEVDVVTNLEARGLH